MNEQNRLWSRRWFEEMWNENRTDVLDEILDADCLGHMESGDVTSIAGFKQARAEFLRQIPDLKFSIEAIADDGNLVAIRWTATGTHAANAHDSSATRTPIFIHGTTWHRYSNGKLVEGWDCWNQGAFERQLQRAADA